MNHMSNEAYLDAESKNVAARGLRLTPSEISQICCRTSWLPEQMY